MPDAARRRLAVLGSPIAHSKSPALHAAAYGVLGLPWSYEKAEISSEGLSAFVNSRDASWRGLSLTMPLKREILPLLDTRDELVELAGGANTVLFTSAGLVGHNTDVYGITRALHSGGVTRASTVQLLGAGATAASVIVAIAALGARNVLVSMRSPEKAGALLALGERLDLRLTIAGFNAQHPTLEPDLVISTLPGGSVVDVQFSREVLTNGTFFDVAYDPWPSALARRWLEAGGRVVSGLEMLAYQALGQVRLFVSGSAGVALENEHAVFAAMRTSVGLGPAASFT